MATNRFIRNIKIEADEQGNIPKTLDLLHEGNWNTPWHGDFETTRADIYEYIDHFNARVGLPLDNDGEAPVNYGHKGSEKAGGWLSNLRAEELDDGRLHLVSDFTPTPAGSQAIIDKEYKYISPEFNPRALPWEDPEEEWRFVSNVLTGAGLTNVPLFKKLKKVAASERPDGSNQSKEGEPTMFKLEDIRGKKASETSTEEKAFLEENKAELTTEELAAHGIETDVAPAPESEEPAPAKVDASAAGQVTISADELTALKASAQRGLEAAQKLEQKEADEFVSNRIKAGQIKSDQKASVTKILLASSKKDRAELEAMLSGLPANQSIGASAIGDSGAALAGSAQSEVHAKVQELVKASAADGKQLAYSVARAQVLEADPSLADRLKNDNEGDK